MNIVFKNLTEVNQLVIKSGCSKRAFGRIAGISHGMIHQLLDGTRQPTANTAKKISDALGKEFDDIFFIEVGHKSNQSA